MKKVKRPSRGILTFLFILIVFCIFMITAAVVGFIAFLLTRLGVFQNANRYGLGIPVIITIAASVVIGTLVAAFISKIPLKPINKLISGMDRLAKGDYEARLDLGEGRVGREISQSFNTLAAELKNTEMLRSDFVNNFSHEFKTPIVSIRGFAKLLQKGELPKETREEYLEIIVEEASRLSTMATNILDLTKVENQSILTDITCFNLSEQIRSCILLLEKKWEEKELGIQAEFGEYKWMGNEEFLKQVWINLLDNAIEACLRIEEPEKRFIRVYIGIMKQQLYISVTNSMGKKPEKTGGRFLSSKSGRDEMARFGFGLMRIDVIAEQNGGYVNRQNEEGVFATEVMLPL